VVFDPADDYLVALGDVLAAPTLRDKIDRLGRPTHEDDLLGRGRIEEVCDFVAGIFVGVGGTSCELVGRAMDVGVFVLVEVTEPVDEGLGLLCDGGVIEPDQRSAG
jgi:hypothetical protein